MYDFSFYQACMYEANTTSSLTVIMRVNYWKPYGNIRRGKKIKIKIPSSLVLSWPIQGGYGIEGKY